MMKKITLLVSAFLIAQFSFAQLDLVYTPGPGEGALKISFSFVEAFDDGSAIINPGDGDGAAFGYNANFTQTFVEGQTDVTIIPNSEIWTANNGSASNFNTFWFSAQGVPRKTLDVLTFNEVQWDGMGDAPAFVNQELTLTVDLTEYTLDPAYTLNLIITVFEAGFSNFRRESVEIPSDGSGNYSVTLSNVSANDRIWQWGFLLSGPMADPADTTLGNAKFSQPALSVADLNAEQFSVSPNPTNDDWSINANQAIESIRVYDILGKEVISLKPNASQVDVDASQLKSGIYLARIGSASGTKTMKLVRN